MKKLFSFIALYLFLASSCKKNEQQQEAFIISKQTLTGNYKITAASISGINIFDNADPGKNVFRPCDKDDIHQLNADESYVVVDAGTACAPSSASMGTWKFISATKLTLDTDEATIKSFNGKELVWQGELAGFPVEVTYTRQ